MKENNHIMTKTRLLAVLFLLTISTITRAQQLTLINRTTVGTDPLGDTGEKFGSLNGKSHQNDAVVTHNGYQYTAYYNDRSPRKIVMARRKLTSTRWEKFVYSRYSQTTNDGHNVISIGKSPHDGTLHLSFDHHGSALNYFKSKPGLLNNPGSKRWDNSQFNNVTDNLGFGKLRGITYPIFVTAPNGNMYFSRRLGNSIVGDQLLYEYKNSKWKNVGKYIEGNDNNAYLDNLYIDKNGRMHAAWIWRSTGGVRTARDICYAYSNDYGRNWFDSKGKKVGTLNNGAMSYNGDPSLTAVPVAAGQMTNQEGMTVDLKGRPHIVHRVGSTIRHFYQNSNGNWQNIDTKLSPRGRASIIADKNHNVYIVFGNFRVARATEAGNYRDWTIVYSDFDKDFTGEPLVDRYRMIEDDVLSVYMMSKNYNSCDVIDFDLGLSDSGPNGYTFSTNERQTVNVSGTMNVAYGANGQFVFLYNRTSNVPCSNNTFGSDPAPGIPKKCYVKSKGDIALGTYLFKNKASGNYLDSDGTTVRVKARTGNQDQQWKLSIPEDLNYNIDSEHSNRGLLDANGNSVVFGSNTAAPSRANDKKWTVEALGNNTYRFKSVRYNRYLAEKSSSNTIEHTNWNGNRAQWILESTNANKSSGLKTLVAPKKELKVFPNPVNNGVITVAILDAKSFNVSIYNVLGARIYNAEVKDDEHQINLDAKLKSGMYLLNAIDEEGNAYSEKLVVK